MVKIILKNYTFVILSLLLLVSCSQEVSDPGADMPMPDVQPQANGDVGTTESSQINFYDVNLADYANLEIVERWAFESDLSTSYDNLGGNMKGAVEVQSYNGVDYLYVWGNTPEGNNGKSINTWLLNNDSNWVYSQSSISDETNLYSHPYGITGPDNQFHLFYQGRTEGVGEDLWISKSVSDDGKNFGTIELFYRIEDDEKMDPYDCTAAAHGRVTQLDDGTYLFAFSASCQRKNFDLANSFMAGMLIGYSSDLNFLEVEELSYVPACNDPTFDTSQGEVYLYCDFSGYVDGDWDDSQYTQNQGLRLVVRYDLGTGYDFNPSEPAGLVHFYDESGEWRSVEDYKIDDIDIHQSSLDGIVRLYSTANTDDGPTIHSFTRMD